MSQSWRIQPFGPLWQNHFGGKREGWNSIVHTSPNKGTRFTRFTIDSQSFTTKMQSVCAVSTATLEAKCAFEKPGFFGRTNFCRFDNSALAKHGTIMSSLECKHVQTTHICSISAAGIASGLFGAWPPLWHERQFGVANWRWMFDWSLSSISYSILLVTSGFGIKKNGPDA